MMKRFFLGGAVPIVVVLVLVGARDVAAVKAPCFTGEERLGLTPNGAVTLDGFSLQRSTVSGRYTTDAGLDFDVNGSTVQAVDPATTACTNTAVTVTLTLTDPFTGVSTPLQAVAP